MENRNYRVIEILSDNSILINYGRDHGANENDQVRVISIGPEIIDPETKENLGTLDTVKADLTIVTAYNKFSLCQDIEEVTKNTLVNPLSQFQTTYTKVKIINVNEKSISNIKPPNDYKINIGDKVEIL